MKCRKEVVSAACDCAELALKHVPEGENRPRKCIEVVRAWAAGTATLDEVRTARLAAYAAAYADAAYAAYAAAKNMRLKILRHGIELLKGAK